MSISAPRIYFSVGDHSGDIHGANLIHQLQQLAPGIYCEGYGGDLMARAGCEIHYPLCNLSVIGIRAALAHIGTFNRLRKQAAQHFRISRPDALVLIDYPGFNWWMARNARKEGIPVFYFIPPQMWAWGGWRIRKMRKLVDHVLCPLPFEHEWYQARHVSSDFVGHPFFDQLRQHRHDEKFLQEQQAKPGKLIALLPGSRGQELDRNTETLIKAAQHIHRQHGDSRFLFACLKPEHARFVQEKLTKLASGEDAIPVEICIGKTSEIIELAHSCLSVSGSVSLELLFRQLPTVILYGATRLQVTLAKLLKTTEYITLVNLLAKREIYPEYWGTKIDPIVLGNHVLHWLENPSEHEKLRADLKVIRDRVAIPGACHKVAEIVLSKLGKQAALPRAA